MIGELVRRRDSVLIIRSALQPRTSAAPGALPLREADERFRLDSYELMMRCQDFAWSSSALGAVAMEALGMDSSGWPVPPGSKSSSHFARHGLSRRAFIGGAAAAAAGTSLGSGLLWPAAHRRDRSPSRRRGRAPPQRPSTGSLSTSWTPSMRVDPSSSPISRAWSGRGRAGTGTGRNPDGSVETLLVRHRHAVHAGYRTSAWTARFTRRRSVRLT